MKLNKGETVMVGQVRQQLETQDCRFEESSSFGENEVASPLDLGRQMAAVRRLHVRPTGRVLAKTIEAEIIPRLLQAFRVGQPGSPAPRSPAETDTSDVVAFTGIALHKNTDQACDYVESLRGRGQSLETIYVDLIEPAARRLGDLWNADACDFVVVTVAVLRLQQVLHHFGLAFRREVEPREHGHRALLVPAPGEKDSFGHLMFGTFELALAAEFLRRDGWDACVDSSASSSDAVRIVRREWFDVVELSLSSESHLDELTSGIRQIRKASRNASLGVMVGGPVFKEHPEMVTRVGADVVAANGRQAAMQADNLMEQLRSR